MRSVTSLTVGWMCRISLFPPQIRAKGDLKTPQGQQALAARNKNGPPAKEGWSPEAKEDAGEVAGFAVKALFQYMAGA